MESASGLPTWKATEFARLLALVEGERRFFQELFAQLPFAAAVFADDGTLELANRAFLRRFPPPSPDLSRTSLFTMLTGADHKVKAQAVLSTGQPHTEAGVEIGRQVFNVALIRVRRPDGTSWSLLAAFLDVPAAAPPKAPVKPEVSVSAPPSRRVSDHLDAVFWEMDPVNYRFRAVSARAAEITGIRREDWRTPADFSQNFVHPYDREQYLEFFGERVRKEDAPALEYRVFPPFGAGRWLRDEVRPVYDSAGRLEAYAGLTFDITERKRLEHDRVEAGKRAAVEHLAGRVSHVANNLLMIIEGYAEDLRASLPANDPRRDDLEAILKASARLAGLTQQMSQLTKPAKVEAEVFELAPWMKEAAARLQEFLDADFTVDTILPEEPLTVRGNRTLFLNILMEAARLARPHLSREARLMLIAVRAPHEDQARLSLRFGNADLPPEVASRFFEPFAGIREAGVDPPLGLAGLVRALPSLGAFARLEGEPGEDPSLVLVLRRAAAAPAPAAEARATAPRYTLLLVDDEESIRSLVKKGLVREGYDVLEAATTSEALRIAREHPGPLDLLITDVDLPEQGGLALAEQFRVVRSSTPVLFITAHLGDPQLDAAHLPPGSGLLKKPFPVSALLEKVQAMLKGQAGAATAGLR